MLLEILDETLEFSNEHNAISEINQVVEQKLNHVQLYFSHFVADGEECYEQLEDYLKDNISQIKKIKIVACTFKELADGILLTAWDYISGVIPLVEELAAQFYKGVYSGSWHKLSQLLEGMQWILESFALLDQQINQTSLSDKPINYPGWEDYLLSIHSLKEIVSELGRAINTQDLILIGDLLTYELIEVLQQMQHNLKNMLPWED